VGYETVDPEALAYSEPSLLVVSGKGQQRRRIPIPAGGLILGRRDHLGPPFSTDELVSRAHLSIRRCENGSIEITDLGSTNGTYINSKQINEPVRMHASDILRIGQIELRLDPGIDIASHQETATGWATPVSYEKDVLSSPGPAGIGPLRAVAEGPDVPDSAAKGFVNVLITGRILWVGAEAYPLQNIARAQTIKLIPRRGKAVRSYLIAIAFCAALGVAPAVAAMKVAIPSSALKVLHGAEILAVALVVISSIWLIIRLSAPTLYALFIETSGTPHRVLASRDENRLNQVVYNIMDAIEHPPERPIKFTLPKANITNNNVYGTQNNVFGGSNIIKGSR
jgi:hypothetical protein